MCIFLFGMCQRYVAYFRGALVARSPQSSALPLIVVLPKLYFDLMPGIST